jgi:hypothetical protein
MSQDSSKGLTFRIDKHQTAGEAFKSYEIKYRTFDARCSGSHQFGSSPTIAVSQFGARSGIGSLTQITVAIATAVVITPVSEMRARIRRKVYMSTAC